MSDLTSVAAPQAYTARSRVIFMVTFVLWWAILALFNAFPSIDIAVAQRFFTGTNCSIFDAVGRTCGSFAYDASPFFTAARNVLFVLPYIAVAVLIADLIRCKFTGAADWKSPRVMLSLTALMSLALGCGLTVNLFLKTFSGRPRPRETSWFGGQLDFVQAGSFAGKCLKNCSFVSGEASSAGWLFCLILLLPARWRLTLGLPMAFISLIIPVMRVLTGAHYLSDVILGWLSSVVIFAGVLAVAEGMTNRRYL
ncbi:phosphatase PAP2 family protein (plasmid) [Rhizobium sp. B230/85]|uniref:phosphatase PAP2 family protein n=1 Tax=unclassified Rhizobium TaxID=2613769 RepID=UPI001ADA24F5|nr:MULTISPECIES: phosphatase PAP2 family protein [unclassified Rhizobium]MBO9136097.1 phosphatase PAP2 family protein [Rhizobium sp. B209b/85]MBO9171408.1 phosphatase PAP2 family protein [Rhizobium sp. L245/93]QXZ99227.1 phosphatase PAP2 family protein [Rhizobium sp. B230/85]